MRSMRAWPVPDPRAQVLAVHGLGEHSGRYAHVATRLVDFGYAVYALDHRGHGRSGGRRAVVDRMDKVVADLRTFVIFAASQHPERKVFLLGHSMGGTISLAFAARHQEEIAGMVLSGWEIKAIRASGLSAGIIDAGLSRGLAGVSGSTLVVNLAGSRYAVRDGMATLNPLAAQIIGQLSSLEI